MDDYLIGQQIRFEGEFTVQDPVTPTERSYADPSATFLRLRHTSDATTTISFQYGIDGILLRDGIGQFHADIVAGGPYLDRVGVWFYRWEGTGNVQAPDEDYIRIDASTVVR